MSGLDRVGVAKDDASPNWPAPTGLVGILLLRGAGPCRVCECVHGVAFCRAVHSPHIQYVRTLSRDKDTWEILSNYSGSYTSLLALLGSLISPVVLLPCSVPKKNSNFVSVALSFLFD